jgi:hypothetical protein
LATSVWAENAAPVQKPAAPAVTTPAKPAPAATTATAPVVKAKPDVKKVATVSPCKGLDEKTCGGNKACAWIVPKDPNDKTGKLQEPYCRKVAGVALKKPMVKPAAAAVAPAAKTVTTTTTTATAPATTAAKTVAKPATAAVAAKPVVTPPAPPAAQ